MLRKAEVTKRMRTAAADTNTSPFIYILSNAAAFPRKACKIKQAVMALVAHFTTLNTKQTDTHTQHAESVQSLFS